MPSLPAPEKPTWRRRRTRRRNLNRDAVRAPLRPRRGRLAGKSVPGGGDPGGAGCAAAAGRCSPVSAARPHVRLPGPPRAAPRPSSTSRRLPGRARPRRPDSAPRAHPGPPARGRPWGEAAGAAGGARGGDRRAQRLHVEGERTVTSRHSGRQTDATWIEQTRTVGVCVYSLISPSYSEWTFFSKYTTLIVN